MRVVSFDSIANKMNYMLESDFNGISSSLSRGLGSLAEYVYMGGSFELMQTKQWHLAFIRL